MTGKTVVVLGGSIGGLGVAHRLLKHTLPGEPDLKVILVATNSHFYWNVAAVRAIIPNILRDDELLQPIAPGFAQYNTPKHPSAAEFIHGSATSIDTKAKVVHVATAAAAASRSVAYDYLVIATGSRSAVPGMPWKADGSHDALVASIHDTAKRVQAASHILVAGGGATGVEVCGELRYEFPEKTVVLLSADEALVGGDQTAPALERALTSMGVVVRNGVRAVGTRERAADGKTDVELSNGETLVTDLYLPTVGMVPNSEFLPEELLDEKKLVKTDECMRVTGLDNVWAVGDVVGKPNAGYLMTEAQAGCVAMNISRVLSGKEQEQRGSVMDILIFATGRSRGVGRYHWVPLPSLAVWIAKSRTLGVERTPKFVDGSMW